MITRENQTETKIYSLILSSPEQTAKSIAKKISLTEGHVGVLLNVMFGVGLLSRRKSGRSFVYSAASNRKSSEEIASIEAVRALAGHLHSNQVDKHGRPIFEHVERVANACSDLSTDQHIAAYLHEVLEDADTDSGRFIDAYSIESIFGKSVAELVLTLTRSPHHTYHQYIVSIAEGNPLAIPIKLADLNDNLDESRGSIPESLRKRYLRARDYLTDALPLATTEAKVTK